MSDQLNSCDKENIIHQLLKVQARVKVKPIVKHGIPKVYCVDSCIKPHFDCCNDKSTELDCRDRDYNHDFICSSDNNCNFTLTQLICVEIPISFGADVDIKKGITCCGNPDLNTDCINDLKNEINENPINILMSNHIVQNPKGGWDTKREEATMASSHFETKAKLVKSEREFSKKDKIEHEITLRAEK